MAETDLEEILEVYFRFGFNHTEILQSLHTDGFSLSLRTLRRILTRAGLYRRKHFSDLLTVGLFLTNEIENIGSLHGYKLMHLRCLQEGLVVTQETIRILLHIIDPIGIHLRKGNRLRRRMYRNPGPDFLWHVDSYDKLKPYGICINGAVDGFSRYVIWLEAYHTNSDPAVIASYYMEAVESRMGSPKRIRSDLGTENGYMENMQRYLRYEHEDDYAKTPFLYGSSNHNQRIESWWAFLRKQKIQFWMNLFQDLKDTDQFTGDFLDKSLIQFCFMGMVQDDLDKITELWNHHRLRPSRNQAAPHGRPSIMYCLPERYGARNHLCEVSALQIQICKDECVPKGSFPCDETVFNLCCVLMTEADIRPPESPYDAVHLYGFLRNEIISNL